MDSTKRQSLKRIAGVTVAGAGFGFVNGSMAANPMAIDHRKVGELEADPALSSIQVHTRLSSSTNDIEVVVTNTGEQTTRITQMTPSQTTTKRGMFDFAKLMNKGELVLESGQSVTVPMTPHPVLLNASTAAQRASSLTDSLRSSFSVITDNAAYARVDVVNAVRFS